MQRSQCSTGLGFNKLSNNMPNAIITLEVNGYTSNVMCNFYWNRRQSHSPPTSGVTELCDECNRNNLNPEISMMPCVK